NKMYFRVTSLDELKEVKLTEDSRVRVVIDADTDTSAIEEALAGTKASWDISLLNTHEPAHEQDIAADDTLSIIERECADNEPLKTLMKDLYVVATTTAV